MKIFALKGHGESGKTTTLRIIGGFEQQDAGDVFFDGEKINDIPPHKRNVNTVFQKYALFPHLNVYENIAFALKLQKLSNAEISKNLTALSAFIFISVSPLKNDRLALINVN